MKLTCRMIIDKRKELWQKNHNIEVDTGYITAAAKKLTEKTKDAADIRAEIQEHPEYIIEMFFVIVNKEQETVPFFLNELQTQLCEILNHALTEYKEGKRNHLNFLLLKGRQGGFTSFITAYQLACTITRKNFSGFTVADSTDNTETIFEDKAKYPYNLLPELIKPTEKLNNRKELTFSNLNSKWRIATAGNKDIGRSKTINFFHGSECAFWESIKTIMTGLGQALTKDSIKILETTANGFNEYRQMWRKAEMGESNWQPLFFEWWRTEEYTLGFTSDAERESFLYRLDNPRNEFDTKLVWLQKVKGLSLEQLNWYDSKRKDLEEKLPQEYPCTPEEAFISSGTNVFDTEILVKRIQQLEVQYHNNPVKRYRIVYQYVNEQIANGSVAVEEDKHGDLIIYKHPEQGHHYVIGADTAEGGKDYNVAQVLDNCTGEQVAKLRYQCDTDLFAKDLYCLGTYYFNALVGPETNFDSHPVKELDRLHYRNMYIRQKDETIGYKVEQKYGFRTTTVTRPIIIGDLKTIVREEIEKIVDIDTLQEMLVFVEINKKPQAAEGEHDDCVMSLGISYHIRPQQRTTIDKPQEMKNMIEKDKDMMVKMFKHKNKRIRRLFQ